MLTILSACLLRAGYRTLKARPLRRLWRRPSPVPVILRR
jgi:hypothetical protein